MGKVKTSVKKMNKLLDAARKTHPDVTYYAYFIESPRSLMVTKKITGPSRIYKYVSENLNADCFDRLKPSSV